MKATSKQEFFELLEVELHRIGIEDTNDIFADFEEHFTDSAMQGIPEDAAAERLGDIKEIARSYLNLESSRINSIMARDVERRKVSLTKPGRGVPADLSLIGSGSARDIANSDNIREYTPQHFSSEIYPQSQPSVNSGGISGNLGNGVNVGYVGNSVNFGQNTNDPNNANNASTGANTWGTAPNGNSAGGVKSAENKTVADAFSDAGRAALDAAKITGHAVADAIKQSGVKEAVVGAGKSAADAVKAAGQSAADAVHRAKRNVKKSARYNGAVPHPSDAYRENMTTANGRTAELPRQHTKAKTSGGYKLIDTAALKPNLNVGKLVAAILMDCFLWSWVFSALIGLTFGGLFGGAVESVVTALRTLFGSAYPQYYLISRIFLSFGFFWLGMAAVGAAWFMLRLIIKLIKFIINLHIKAIYDL